MRDRAVQAVGLLVAGVLAAVPLTAVLVTSVAGPAGAAATSAEKAQAKKALVVRSDLPAGWTSSPSSSNSGGGSFTGSAQLAGCLGVPRQIIEDNPPEVDSPQFSSKAGTLQVEDSISIFPSAKFAQEEYTAVSSRKAPGCLHTLLNSSLNSALTGSSGSGATPDSMAVTKTASPKGTTAFDLDTSLTSQGKSVPIRLEIIFFVRGPLGDALELSSYGSSTMSPSLVQHLTSLAESRL